MSNGFLLDRDSIAALARLLRERGIGNQTIERSVVDTWPTCHPARVTEAITARDQDEPGKGKVKLLVSDQVTGDAETQNIKLINGDDTEEQQVYRISKATEEVAVDTEGYVIQDRTGKLWWLEVDLSEVVHFKWESDSPATYNDSTIPQSVREVKLDGTDGGIVQVVDPHYLAINAKPDMTGVAVKGPLVSGGGRPHVIVASQTLPQTIIGKILSGGYQFSGESGSSVTLQEIIGVDKPWPEELEEIAADNPHEIKVWNKEDEAGPCIIRAQYNAKVGMYEIVEATQKYVMHGVRLTTGCVFQQLTYSGEEDWNDPGDWTEKLSTEADWVTRVYIADGKLMYDKRCEVEQLIITLNLCKEQPPSPLPE